MDWFGIVVLLFGVANIGLPVFTVLEKTQVISMRNEKRRLTWKGYALIVSGIVTGVAVAVFAVRSHVRDGAANKAAIKCQDEMSEQGRMLGEQKKDIAKLNLADDEQRLACDRSRQSQEDVTNLLGDAVSAARAVECGEAVVAVVEGIRNPTLRDAVKDRMNERACSLENPLKTGGGSSLLLLSRKSKDEAVVAYSGIYRMIEKARGAKVAAYLQKPFPSFLKVGRGSSKYWVVALKDVEPSAEKDVCAWLLCHGFFPGAGGCGTMPVR